MCFVQYCNSQSHTAEKYFIQFWREVAYFKVLFIEYNDLKSRVANTQPEASVEGTHLFNREVARKAYDFGEWCGASNIREVSEALHYKLT